MNDEKIFEMQNIIFFVKLAKTNTTVEIVYQI